MREPLQLVVGKNLVCIEIIGEPFLKYEMNTAGCILPHKKAPARASL
jgi:hypothetical protein